MKRRPLILALSLLANAALLAVVSVGLRAGRAREAEKMRADAIAADLARAQPAAPAPLDAAIWRGLPAGDLAALVARLRAEGFPPNVLRGIVAALVHEQFAARRKAIEVAEAAVPFWRTTPWAFHQSAARRALGREERAAVQALVGEEGSDPTFGGLATLRRQFPGFSEEKLAALERLTDEHNERWSDVMSQGGLGGIPLPDVGERRAAQERDFQARLLEVLTPAEREEFNLRWSDTADTLRDDLGAFDPTEQEFRAIFRLRQAFDERYGQNWGMLPVAEQRARHAAEEQLEKDLRAALGETRYADYERANDYDYQQITHLVARLDQPVETARQLWDWQSEIERRAERIFVNRQLTPEQRREQIGALVTEARAGVSARIGPRGLESYLLNAPSSWLERLQTRVDAPKR